MLPYLAGLTIAVILTTILWYILDYFLSPSHLKAEPPILPARIPYVGHILGLLQHGTKYFDITSARSRSPIYTLNMLNSKVYVVTTPELVSSVNRARALAFNPFIAQLGKRITGHDEAAGHIIQYNLNGENGPGYVPEIHDGSIIALAEPETVNTMTRKFLQEISMHEQESEIDLFSWLRQIFGTCGTTAIYGPENPLAQNGAELVKAFWDFDTGLNLIMVDFFPRMFASTADRARTKLVAGFYKYFKRYKPETSSAYTQTRHSVNRKYNLDDWNAARLEVGALLGILANVVPATFYTIMHIYSDKDLLGQIREELEATSVVKSDPVGDRRTLKLVSMRESCHLLHATFKEVLRHHALGSSARYVREDVMLDNQYLLNRGMIVQMPMAALHKDPTAWGPDVSSFRPSRFLKDDGGAASSKGGFKPNFAAFRPFGGGTNLCPGRHLATSEVMALTAFMVLHFSMEPADGGAWEIPKPKQRSLATNVFPPERDVRVRLRKREGYADVQWDFSMS